MEVRTAASPKDVKHYTTDRLREEYLIQDKFQADKINLVYSHIDRIITGAAVPVNEKLVLTAGDELRAEYFLQRRELGIINIGGDGIITIDGRVYEVNARDGMYVGRGSKDISFESKDASNPAKFYMNIGGDGIITIDGRVYEVNARDGMYVGRGSKDISFESKDASNPAKFYMNSAPAHVSYPTVHIKLEGEAEEGVVIVKDENKVELGTLEDSNHRIINKYIVTGQVESCQLAMGLTKLLPGSVWNTMPSHTHDRRMEVYLYFDMDDDSFVMHYMGEPQETRHIIMHNEEAVISPSWSIHSGCGSKAYTFIWGMCGENQDYGDMDTIANKDLR